MALGSTRRAEIAGEQVRGTRKLLAWLALEANVAHQLP
jgi:hypothetical protein